MKLNYRDKVILTTVIVIAVWVLGLVFFIVPAYDDVKTADNNLTNAKVTLSDLNNQIEQDKNLNQDIVDAYKNVNQVASNFYDIQATQDATAEVNRLLGLDTITNSGMTITPYATMVLSPFAYSDTSVYTDIDIQVDDYDNGTAADDSAADGTTTDGTDVAADGTTITADQTIGYYNISFSFKGKYSDVQSFCEKLTTNDEKSLVVNSIDISKAKGEGATEGDDKLTADTQVEGSMTLNMMVIKKLSDPTASTDKAAS